MTVRLLRLVLVSFLVLLAGVAAQVVVAPPVLACVCEMITEDDADPVFVGRVRHRLGDDLTFAVDRAVKGDLRGTARVRTAPKNSDCAVSWNGTNSYRMVVTEHEGRSTPTRAPRGRRSAGPGRRAPWPSRPEAPRRRRLDDSDCPPRRSRPPPLVLATPRPQW